MIALGRILLGALAALASVRASAGVNFTLEGKDKERLTVYLQGNKLRAESGTADQQRVTLLDGDTKKIIVMEPKAKVYTEITREEMKAAGAKMNEQLKKALENASPEQRKQMEAMMAQRGLGSDKKVTITFQPTGEKATIAGYPCEGYQQLKDGKPEAEACFIPWSKLGIPKSEFDAYAQLSTFAGSMLSGFQGAHEDPEDRAKQILDKAPGFPARQAHILPNGQKSAEQKLVSIKKMTVPPDKFEPPPSFTKAAKPAGSP